MMKILQIIEKIKSIISKQACISDTLNLICYPQFVYKLFEMKVYD